MQLGLLHELASLQGGHPESVPVKALVAVPGTPGRGPRGVCVRPVFALAWVCSLFVGCRVVQVLCRVFFVF